MPKGRLTWLGARRGDRTGMAAGGAQMLAHSAAAASVGVSFLSAGRPFEHDTGRARERCWSPGVRWGGPACRLPAISRPLCPIAEANTVSRWAPSGRTVRQTPIASNGEPLMVRCRALLSCLVAALFVTLTVQAAMAAEEYSEAKLQSFASAVLAVNAIVEQWRPQIQAAPSEADKQQMAAQANQEMRAAVEGTEGMTVEEYQAIAQAAQADPQLMARLDQVFRDMAPAAQ